MTGFRIEQLAFDSAYLDYWVPGDPRFRNWPVVYTLESTAQVYVGESLNVASRLRQHLDSTEKRGLTQAKVLLGETFNKSVCLDLESYLIRLFSGDGRYEVLNRNDGVINADYFDRATYQTVFDEIFEQLRQMGMFTRSVRDIENGDLFKLSPFKALTPDQGAALENILEGLFEDLGLDQPSTIVIQGDPGTGKTVVAIYLLKLLMDIRDTQITEPTDRDTIFSDFFAESFRDLLTGFRVGLVVPQQSLRKSVQRVFRKTPGLDPDMVMSPFDVGSAAEPFDLVVVDEAHRLNQRASQASGMKNRQFAEINERLFGWDDPAKTQVDWIKAQSTHQVFLLDAGQSVRPADLPKDRVDDLVAAAQADDRSYRLFSQLRVAGGEDYIDYVRRMLSDTPPQPTHFAPYEFRLFTDFAEMVTEIRDKDKQVGLSRLVAGYAWPWRSKKDKSLSDIEIDSVPLQWNSTDVDWVNAPNAVDEVGSIHTVQGYDLNYAGVIIGRDLRWDTAAGRLRFDRSHYFDAKGMENNRRLGITYDDEDLLGFVTNIYAVLLTRGITGTFVYVCDPALREHLRTLIASA